LSTAIFHAFIVFFLSFASMSALGSMGLTKLPLVLSTSAIDSGKLGSIYSMGVVVFAGFVAVVNGKVLAESIETSFNYVFTTIVSLVMAIVWMIAYAQIDWEFLGDQKHGVLPKPATPIIFISSVSSIVLSLAFRHIRRIFSPTVAENARALVRLSSLKSASR
jgi:hypothetical protein